MAQDTSSASLSNASQAVKGTLSPAAQFIKNELANLEWPREGSVVEAAFLKKAGKMAYFDLGRFGIGVIFGAEYLNARDAMREIKPGDRVPAKVIALDGEGGYLEISLTEASRQKVWQQAQDFLESGELVKVKVTAMNPGGFLVQMSELKAFLPFSQMSNEHYPKDETNPDKIAEEMQKLIGQELSVKVINVNQKKNKLIVSERESVSVNLKELLSAYQVGQTVDGVVSGIADFGIFVKFVDNPQIEGLVHISEIDHRIVDNPKEVVQMNEPVKIKIIDIKDGRVFLSLKALKEDPWQKVGDQYKAGQDVQGTIYKFNPFGAVISLADGMQGVIHVSEFGGAEEMKKTLQPGQAYDFVIESVKPEEKRIVLKVKK